jgi:GNAT superfamily N-acetyltransferase
VADAPVVHEITDLAYARYVPLLGRKPQPMTADHQAMIAEHEVWLLVDDVAPIGVLELVNEPGCTLIYSVAVRPEHHGQGLGRMLLDWAEGQTAWRRPRPIRLYTNALMVDNLRL